MKWSQVIARGIIDGLGAHSRGGALGGLTEMLGATAQQNAQRKLQEQMSLVAYHAFQRVQNLGGVALRDTRFELIQQMRRGIEQPTTKYDDGDCHVEVKFGVDADTLVFTVDILVFDRQNRLGAGLHEVHNAETSEVVYSNWEPDRTHR